MVKRIQRFKTLETYVSNKRFSYTLPKAPISKIIISGTFTSCTGTTYTANTIFEFIQVRINGKMFIDLTGDEVVDAIPWSWQIWREFYKQKHHVAMPDEQFIIELPDALPRDAQIDLIIKCRVQTSIGLCTASVIYKWDILFEMEDKVPGKVLVPYIINDKIDTGSATGKSINYVPAMPFRLRAICFAIEDDDSLDASAIARITIEDASRIYFEGKLIELEALQEGRSRLALTTGMYIFAFKGGIKVPPESLKITLDKESTGGTDVEVHFLYISY